jgi:hypothetical protein
MDVTTQATIEEKTLEQIDKLTRANDARGIELINLRKACTKAIASNASFSRAQFLRNEEIKKSFNDGNELIDKVLDLQNEWNATIGAMVPSRLWKFIADEGGVCQHLFEFEILTKLNENEIKFLYGTNTESRLAIKRAKIKLSKKSWIYELSSISQLELAWANYEWGSKGKYSDGTEYTKNQENFCRRVALTNDLALLRWVREAKECAWDWRTSDIAAILGNLEMLKYCVENGCEVDDSTCATAAEYGHLDCLKYLREKNVDWGERVCEFAHEKNHIDCLAYAIKNKAPGFEHYQ